MLDEVDSLFTQVIVDVHPFWVTGICHAVVADENNVDDFGEIATLQGVLKILSEEVNSL